jgi:hypothetical protein
VKLHRNEAAILAARKDKDIVERAEIMEAIRRVGFLFAVIEFLNRVMKKDSLLLLRSLRTCMQMVC